MFKKLSRCEIQWNASFNFTSTKKIPQWLIFMHSHLTDWTGASGVLGLAHRPYVWQTWQLWQKTWRKFSVLSEEHSFWSKPVFFVLCWMSFSIECQIGEIISSSVERFWVICMIGQYLHQLRLHYLCSVIGRLCSSSRITGRLLFSERAWKGRAMSACHSYFLPKSVKKVKKNHWMRSCVQIID